MRKNLLLLLLFCISMMTKAQDEPVITLTAGAVETGGTEGLVLNFNTAVAGTNLQIDWGNGTKVTTDPIEVMDAYGTHTPVSGIPVGNREIKIYGEGITYFDCSYNKDYPTKITSLDVTKAVDLLDLELASNGLSTLDVTKNVNLTKLVCNGNALTQIDLSKNVNLTYITFMDNELATLNVTSCLDLDYLHCGNNKIKTLDLSKCTKLKSLYALNNELASVSLATQNEKAFINVSGNKLEKLDLTKCGKITSLFCQNNQIDELKVGQIATTFNCSGNKLNLATLPVGTGAKNFTYAPQNPMSIDANYFIGEAINFATLDNLKGITTASQTTVFTWKTEDGTVLESGTDYEVNGAVFTFLKPQTGKVYCEMTTPAFPMFKDANIFKTDLAILNEEFTEPVITLTAGVVVEGGDENLNLAFNTAVANTKLLIDWGNGTKVITKPVAEMDAWATHTEAKGIPSGDRIIKVYGEGITYFDCSYSKDYPTKITSLDVTKAVDLLDLELASNGLSTLDVTKNVNLTKLVCNGNALTQIDLSKNANLTYITFMDNELEALNVTSCLALDYLHCGNNKIKTLDLSKCTELKSLYALNNELTSVDLATQNTKGFINVNGNKLTSLDLTKCGVIETLHCMNNQLIELTINANGVSKTLNCSNNKLTLATLPTLALKGYTYAPQSALEIPTEITTDDKIDLSAQTGVKGVESDEQVTVYTWKKADGTALVLDTDYTEHGGVFKFLKTFDDIYCEMSTPAFPAFTTTKIFKTTNVEVKVGTGIDRSATDDVKIYTEPGKLIIEGLNGSETINVFTVQGIRVLSTVAADAVATLPLSAGQYIILIDNVAHKAIIR